MRDRKSIIAGLSLAIVACSDGTGPLGLVSLCPDARWAGIEREGEAWQSIPVTRSAFPLRKGERIGLARIRADVDSLQIYYVTAEQAEATFSCAIPPTKELHGTVQGLGTAFTSRATVSIGTSLAFPSSGAENFTIRKIPNGPVDVVATRVAPDPMVTIIRRGVDYPNGSTIPALDLSSSEAFSLQVNTATVSGTDNFEFAATSEIVTQRGTQGSLRYTFVLGGTVTVPMYSVPESKMVDGELNSLTIDGAYGRVVTLFYRSPSDRTVELGPRASAPTLTRIGIAPNRTARIDVASQPEYGSQITLSLCGLDPSLNPTVIATKEYFGGTPAVWSVTFPDLQAVDGFPSFWGDPRTSGLCGIMVTDRPYLFSARSARDGETYRSALAPGVLYTP